MYTDKMDESVLFKVFAFGFGKVRLRWLKRPTEQNVQTKKKK